MAGPSEQSSPRDPKPENETTGKLSSGVGCGPLNASSRRNTDAEKGSKRREDCLRLTPGGERQEGGRRLPRDGGFAADLLRVEETVRRGRSERVARTASTPRGESEAEDARCGPDTGQAHPAGG